MRPSDDPSKPPLTGVLMQVLMLGALAMLCVAVLEPFLVPILWAAILAYVSWPVFRWLSRPFGSRRTAAAAAMTVLAATVLLAPLVWLAFLLQQDIGIVYKRLTEIDLPSTLRTIVARFPALVDWVRPLLEQLSTNPSSIRDLLIDAIQRSRAQWMGIVGDTGRNVGKLFVALATLFFFYRDGPSLAGQASRVLRRFLGVRLEPYLLAAGAMTRAVIYGLLSTALVQGLLAGAGFAIVGVGAPTMLGVLTAFASILPVVGTFLVWGSIGVWLIVDGQLWQGVGLLAWGTLLVHPADNIIRPLLISGATRVPFLLVMFGVVGGLSAFGLVGVFIGPVALAVAAAIWREWQAERVDGPGQAT